MSRIKRLTRSSKKTIDPVHVEIAKLSGYGAPPSPLTSKGEMLAVAKHQKHRGGVENEGYVYIDDVQSSPLTPSRSSSAVLSPSTQYMTPPKERTSYAVESTVSIIFKNMSTEVSAEMTWPYSTFNYHINCLYG
jgi:hypothetical protein